MARDTRAATAASPRPAEFDLLYAHPYPFNSTPAGGAMSHVRGFLHGLVESSATCKIYSGISLGFTGFDSKAIPAKRRFAFFTEAETLVYNWHFARRVQQDLGDRRVRAIYQRH